MSNIDKQALRELIREAGRRKIIVPAKSVEALLDELEAKDKLNAELMEKQRLIDICQGQGLEHRIAAEKRAEAAEKRIAELSGEFFALPPLNDDLVSILGRPNFTCAHLAELLRKGGQDIRRKAEHEQAAVIYWFLDLYLKYGDKWESIAKDDIQARAAMLTAGIGKGE
jgi:hypothetical protein